MENNFPRPKNVLSNLKDAEPAQRSPATLTASLSIIIDSGIVKDLEVRGNAMTFEEIHSTLKLAQQIYEKKVLEEALEKDE